MIPHPIIPFFSQTFLGKVFGGLCAILGVFTLTLPIPIVVNRQVVLLHIISVNQTFLLIFSFAGFYKNRLWRNEVAHKKRVRLEEKAAARQEEEEEIILPPESRQTLIKATGGGRNN